MKRLFSLLMPTLTITLLSGCIISGQQPVKPKQQTSDLGANGYREDPAYINLLTQRKQVITEAKIEALARKVEEIEKEKNLLLATLNNLRRSVSSRAVENDYSAVGLTNPHLAVNTRPSPTITSVDNAPVDLSVYTSNTEHRTKLNISRPAGDNGTPTLAADSNSTPYLKNASYSSPSSDVPTERSSVNRSVRVMYKVMYVFNDKDSWLHYDEFIASRGIKDRFKREARDTGEYVIYAGTFNSEAAALRHKAYLARKTRTDHAIIRQQIIQL